MGFWNEQRSGHFAHKITHNINVPKYVNDEFKENEMIDLANEGQALWAGIAKVASINTESFDYGPHGDYTTWITTIKLELEGQDGSDTFTLVYGDHPSDFNRGSKYREKKFKEGANISFVGTKDDNQLHLIMVGEPADLEAIQEKVNDAIENGRTIIKINKIKEQLQTAGALLVEPLVNTFNDLRDAWEARKQAKTEREKARIAEEKAQREAKNNRPTGMYSQPEEQSRNGNISK